MHFTNPQLIQDMHYDLVVCNRVPGTWSHSITSLCIVLLGTVLFSMLAASMSEHCDIMYILVGTCGNSIACFATKHEACCSPAPLPPPLLHCSRTMEEACSTLNTLSLLA